MAYENRHSFRDGKVVLYTRNGKATYHARLSIDGVDGYVVKSTKRNNLDDARRIAEDWFDDYRYRQKNGLAVGKHTFASLWKQWLASHRNVLSEHRLRYISGIVTRYLMPYFGSEPTSGINDKLIARYWDWRINYWSSAAGVAKIEQAEKTRTTAKRPYKQKLGNVAKVPAQKTLNMEQSVLRQILSWGARNGIMGPTPDIKAPKLKANAGVVRRPAFDLDEWRKLYRFFRVWVTENEVDPASPAPRKQGPTSLHREQRELLRNYVMFLGSSGLRPNEARQLRWQDVSSHKDQNGNHQIVLYIAPTTKTGERECIPLRNAHTILDRIRRNSRHTEPTSLVFADRDGNAIDNFGKTFKSVLEKTNLLTDRFGRARTIYSLRHTYATFRLLYGNVQIEDLAQNMGTSPATIFNHYRHVTTRQKAHVLGGTLHTEFSRKGMYL